MVGWFLDLASKLKQKIDRARVDRRWARLRGLGLLIGKNVFLPDSTWIDPSHCFLISIGDNSGFGEECMILAHDAQMDEFLDAARIGRVVIHPSCHIGARTVILAGVEIGPRTIVGANSVVSSSLPPETICVGIPAKVICTLDQYLEKHRQKLAGSKKFDYMKYDIRFLTPERRAELVASLVQGDAYMVGGHSAELRGQGGTRRTPRGDPAS